MTIAKTILSISTLHGDERSQRAKHASFMAFQIKQREIASGLDPSPILKTTPVIMTDIPALLDQIVRDGLLEDRAEYSRDDLARMYGIPMNDAEDLFSAIYDRMNCKHRDNGRGICSDCGHVL